MFNELIGLFPLLLIFSFRKSNSSYSVCLSSYRSRRTTETWSLMTSSQLYKSAWSKRGGGDNHFVFLFANTPLRSPVRSSSVTWVWFSISLFSTSRNGRSSALLIGSERLRWTEVMPCEHSSALKCFQWDRGHGGTDLSSGASCVNVSH